MSEPNKISDDPTTAYCEGYDLGYDRAFYIGIAMGLFGGIAISTFIAIMIGLS